MTNSLFEPPFVELRGNVLTSSIARWKARGQFPIRDNWTFFASSHGWDVISKYWSKSVLFRGRWVTLSANFRWKGKSPPTIVGVRKLECFTISQWKPNDPSLFVWIGYQRVTDRQTGGRGRTNKTDGRNCRSYYSALHCKQCVRAVKITWQMYFTNVVKSKHEK